jgi:Zn-dependent protease
MMSRMMGPKAILGRPYGIEVSVSWSALLLAGLSFWALDASILPSACPGQGARAYATAALVGTLALLAGLLAHEMAHAMQAREEGAEGVSASLWALGGMAQVGTGDYASPGAEARVAGAGPVATLGLAGAFWGLSLLHDPALSRDTLSWLAWANAVILAFNLLPGLPLDGGRLLHAALWRWRGDLAWATHAACAVGRAFGWALCLVPLGVLVLTQDSSLILLLPLGAFIISSARAEEESSRARQALSGLIVSNLMARKPECLPASMTLRDFRSGRGLDLPRKAAYPVLGPDGEIAGLFLAKGASRRRQARCLGALALPLERVPTCLPDDDLRESVLAQPSGCPCSLVREGRRLEGLLFAQDVDAHLAPLLDE